MDHAWLSRAERAVLDAVDEQVLVGELVEMIRVPSITGTDAESELQHWYAGRLARLGFEVDTWKLDLVELAGRPDFPGTEAPRSEGYGVVGVLGPVGGPALALQAHVDVVPTGDLAQWPERDPWSGSIWGRTVHGRGACDMKAGAAANLAVARAVVASGVTLERSLALHSVITEPTSGDVLVATAGALTFELRVAGRAAHASARLSGHSALDAFLPVHAALARLERERNAHPHPLFAGNPLPYAISIGTLHAGDWGSSVPDLLVARGRLGVQLDEPPASARAALERAVADACERDPWLSDHPVSVTWTGGQYASGRTDTAHPLVADVQDAIRDAEHRRAVLRAAPYGSDLRLYAGLGGIPTLHYGPGDVRFAHAPREQVDIGELVRITHTLALLTARRCGAHV